MTFGGISIIRGRVFFFLFVFRCLKFLKDKVFYYIRRVKVFGVNVFGKENVMVLVDIEE